MDQIAAALSHYWHLRSQGLSPTTSADHTREKFGVEVASVRDSWMDSEVVEPMEFGTDFCKTIVGSSTGPQYGS